jgi:RNA polymerase sigma-70 factor (ECF subfamily)
MDSEQRTLTAARAGDEQAFEELVAPYRRELRAHCCRMSGSLNDADDLLQESLLRIWRGLGAFEGRSSFRTWIYRVTTRACLDVLEKKSPRLLPMDLGPASGGAARPPRFDPIWIEPCPAELYADEAPLPDARFDARESVGLAFLVALQVLPPRQRAVVVLRDVLGWSAAECAELLDLSVAAVNSALQRGRETLATRAPSSSEAKLKLKDEETTALLGRYMRAWEHADVPALVALMREGATLAMPPLPDWLQGAATIGAALQAMILTPEARGRFRLVRTELNGADGVASYALDANGAWVPQSVHVIAHDGQRISSIVAFVDGSLFAKLGLAATLG